MASPGGAARAQAAKKRGTTLPLTAFLKPEVTSWADDDPESDTLPALPTAPGGGPSSYGSHGSSARSATEPDVSRLPVRPPFKAFVGNLAYDVTAGEVGEYFFNFYQVESVLILKHDDTGNVKGAFVEFKTYEDLRGALSHNGRMLKDRAMRVDVASDKPSRGGGFDRRGGYDAGGSDSRGPGRQSYDDDRGGGYGSFEDRRGGYSDRPMHGSRGGFGDRPDFGDRGGFRGDRGGFGDRSGFIDRREGPDMGERRPKDRGFSGAAEEEMDAPRWGHKQALPPRAAPSTASAEPSGPPVERKRLVLAPRSKAADDGNLAVPKSPQSSQSSDQPKKSNPFGNAKPVDATARLREMEERIAKEKADLAAARAKEREQKEQEAKEREAREREAKQQKAKEREPVAAAPPPPPEDQPGPVPPPSVSGRAREPPASVSGRGQGLPALLHGRGGRGQPPASNPGPGWAGGPPPSGPGRGQGQGVSLEAVNGRLSAPPGMDGPGRGMSRGRRGRGREGGRGRHPEYGRGRGPPQGTPPPPQYHQQLSLSPQHKQDADNSSQGFQEAVDKRSRGRSRGWETHTPSSTPKQQDPSQQGAEPVQEKEVSKVTNMFDVLNAED